MEEKIKSYLEILKLNNKDSITELDISNAYYEVILQQSASTDFEKIILIGEANSFLKDNISLVNDYLKNKASFSSTVEAKGSNEGFNNDFTAITNDQKEVDNIGIIDDYSDIPSYDDQPVIEENQANDKKHVIDETVSLEQIQPIFVRKLNLTNKTIDIDNSGNIDSFDIEFESYANDILNKANYMTQDSIDNDKIYTEFCHIYVEALLVNYHYMANNIINSLLDKLKAYSNTYSNDIDILMNKRIDNILSDITMINNISQIQNDKEYKKAKNVLILAYLINPIRNVLSQTYSIKKKIEDYSSALASELERIYQLGLKWLNSSYISVNEEKAVRIVIEKLKKQSAYRNSGDVATKLKVKLNNKTYKSNKYTPQQQVIKNTQSSNEVDEENAKVLKMTVIIIFIAIFLSMIIFCTSFFRF